MNKRSIFGYTLVMVLLAMVALQVSTSALTGKGFLPTISSLTKSAPKQTVSSNFRCSDTPPITALSSAQDPQLQKLNKYQELCHSAVTNHIMIFNEMPKDLAEATDMGQKMAITLKEFDKFGVSPLVITEPVADGTNLDWSQLEAGAYSAQTQAYFQTLKSHGISVKQMGTWVPLPEGNLPYWARGATTPADFATIVNKYLGIAQQSFPGLQGSVLLNSATYSAADFNWANGEYVSLVPYVKGLDHNLVQSFGMEGFPWMPPANENGSGIFDASEFLNYKLAKEAADTMTTKSIWLNTGTFISKYVGDPTRQTYVGPGQRADVLNGIITQAEDLHNLGYATSINLFAQNKGNQPEATDWSYFSDQTITTSQASPVFTDFASRLNQKHIPLWLFDKEGT